MAGSNDVLHHRPTRPFQRRGCGSWGDDIASRHAHVFARPTTDTVELPAPRRLMAIDRLAWEQLKAKVAGLGAPNPWRQNAGWFFAAVSVSFVTAAISGPDVVLLKAVEGSLSALSLVLAVLLLMWGVIAERAQRTRVNELLLHLEEIEHTFASVDSGAGRWFR